MSKRKNKKSKAAKQPPKKTQNQEGVIIRAHQLQAHRDILAKSANKGLLRELNQLKTGKNTHLADKAASYSEDKYHGQEVTPETTPQEIVGLSDRPVTEPTPRSDQLVPNVVEVMAWHRGQKGQK